MDGLHGGPRSVAGFHSLSDKTRAAPWAELFDSAPPPQDVPPDRRPLRRVHYSTNHASLRRFSAISFSRVRHTLSDGCMKVSGQPRKTVSVGRRKVVGWLTTAGNRRGFFFWLLQ